MAEICDMRHLLTFIEQTNCGPRDNNFYLILPKLWLVTICRNKFFKPGVPKNLFLVAIYPDITGNNTKKLEWL